MAITTYILNFSNSTLNLHSTTTGFPGGSAGKNTPAVQETWVQSLGWEDPPERDWQPTPVFWPGEFHGQRRLVGYWPWGHKESDTTE